MMQRRHRLTTALEIQYVKEAVRTRLIELLEGRKNETEATVLFQVWWRLTHPRQGQPAYPPFSWSSLRAHINPMMVPLEKICGGEIRSVY